MLISPINTSKWTKTRRASVRKRHCERGEGRTEGRRGREMGQGGEQALYCCQSTAQSARPAPEGDISLQLCKDLCSVYHPGVQRRTAGLKWSLAQRALLWINWPGLRGNIYLAQRLVKILFKGHTRKYCIRGPQIAPVDGTHSVEGEGGRHPRF